MITEQNLQHGLAEQCTVTCRAANVVTLQLSAFRHW